MCIYRNSFGVNAIINSNKICIRYNIKVLNFHIIINTHFITLKKSFIEVYKSEKSEFRSNRYLTMHLLTTVPLQHSHCYICSKNKC